MHSEHLHPTLVALVNKAADEGEIFVSDLVKGDIVEVETRNHVYRLEVVEPKNRLVKVDTNHPEWDGRKTSCVVGSSLTGTGTMIKMGWIAVGYELYIDDWALTAIQSIKINGKTIDFSRKAELN